MAARANQLGRQRWASITNKNNSSSSKCYFIIVDVIIGVVAVVVSTKSSILKCIFFNIILFKLQGFNANRQVVHIALFRLHWPTIGCVLGNNIALRQRELEQQMQSFKYSRATADVTVQWRGPTLEQVSLIWITVARPTRARHFPAFSCPSGGENRWKTPPPPLPSPVQ